jgi:hypothetical protein
MSGTAALFVVETSLSVPVPMTPNVVPEEFTLKFSVPADSPTAPTPTLNGPLAEKATVPNVSTPPFTVVVPEYVLAAHRLNLPAPVFVNPAVPPNTALIVVVALPTVIVGTPPAKVSEFAPPGVSNQLCFVPF